MARTNPLSNPLWIWTWQNLWSNNIWTAIRNWVISWEALSKETQKKKTENYFSERQKVNNDIATWKITSWNKAQDTITVRKNNLVNLFAADALEKWANPDKVTAITKKPDEVIKRLSSLGEQQSAAVNEYLMKGWYADRVFDYVMWNSKSPYLTKEDSNNFVWWVKSVPQQTIGTLLDVARSWLSKIWLVKTAEEQNKEDYEEYSKLTWAMTTEDYNLYKQGKAKGSKLFNTGIYKQYGAFNEKGQSFVNGWLKSRADMYDAYDKAVEDWFNWSVEDYANYMNSMAANVSWGIHDAIKRELENTYDTDSWAYQWGKIVWNILEFMATPEIKGAKLLSQIPKVWKYVEGAWEWGIKNYPKTTKRLKSLEWWLEWWVKMQALEDAYNNELSSSEQYLISAWINAAVWWILDWVVSTLKAPSRLMWNPRWSAKTAIGSKTTAEWDEMTQITKESLKNPNADVTPFTRMATKLKEIKKELTDKRVISGKDLQKTRQKLQFKQWEKYTLDDLESQLNDRLMSLSRRSSQGKWKRSEESVPQISFKWWKLSITNLDKLNLFAKNEWDKIINLWDKIQKIWDSTIWVGKKPNATTMEQFLRKLKSEVHQWYAGWEDNMIKVLRNWVDKAWNKYTKTLTNKSKTSLKEASSESAWDIWLSQTFDDLIWSLEWDIYSVWAAQWTTRTTEATKRLFKVINDKLHIDMNNELNAWIINMALHWDKNSAMALLDTIYPSAPWMMEFAIKNILWSVKRAWARRATSDYAQQAWNKVRENIRNWLWSPIIFSEWDM